MENKQSPSKKKLLSIREEKLIRQVDYDTIAGVSPRLPKNKLLLGLEICQNTPSHRQRQGPPSPSQRVLVSIKPRVPAIKTIYITEKNRFHSKKGSEKSDSRSRLGIGDHSSLNSTFVKYFSKESSNEAVSLTNCTPKRKAITTNAIESGQISITTDLQKSVIDSLCSRCGCDKQKTNVYNDTKRPAEKCYVYTQPQFTTHIPRVEAKTEKPIAVSNKINIGTLIIMNTSSNDHNPISSNILKSLHKRIDQLERKLLRHEMVFRSLDPNLQLSSSDEECKKSKMKASSGSGRPCCSSFI